MHTHTHCVCLCVCVWQSMDQKFSQIENRMWSIIKVQNIQYKNINYMYFRVFECYTSFIIIKWYLLINTAYSWIWAQFWKLFHTLIYILTCPSWQWMAASWKPGLNSWQHLHEICNYLTQNGSEFHKPWY